MTLAFFERVSGSSPDWELVALVDANAISSRSGAKLTVEEQRE